MLLRLFAKSPQNISILILRYLNVWVLVGIPLLFSKNKTIIDTLPFIGFGGLSFLMIGLISYRLRSFFITYYYLSGITLIAFFISLIFLYSNNFYYLGSGAFLLGFTIANYEVKSMYAAISSEVEKEMIKNLGTYNMFKVMGIALGFFWGALLSGNKAFYYSSFLFTGFALSILLASIIIAAKKEMTVTSNKISDIGISNISWKKLSYALLFILDVMLFTFWYVYLPQKMIAQGFIGIEISIFLSLQAFSHAICQSLWGKLIIKFGALKSYCVSFLLHIFIVLAIGNIMFNFLIGCILFIIMGTFNSGTFLASSRLFYGNKSKSLSDNYLHLGSSHLGKTLGTLLCQL